MIKIYIQGKDVILMNMISNCFKHKKEIFERTLKIIIAVASANNNNSEKVTIAEVVHYKEEIMANLLPNLTPEGMTTIVTTIHKICLMTIVPQWLLHFNTIKRQA